MNSFHGYLHNVNVTCNTIVCNIMTFYCSSDGFHDDLFHLHAGMWPLRGVSRDRHGVLYGCLQCVRRRLKGYIHV